VGGIAAADPLWGVRTLEFVTALEAATGCSDVMQLFGREIAALGFNSYIMVALDERTLTQRLMASGWHPEWIATYTAENLSAADPVRRQASRAINPFFWSEVSYNPEREPRAKEIMELAADFQMNEGFCLPIRDGNTIAAISIAGDKPDLGHGVKAALHIMSLFAYNRFRALTNPPLQSSLLTEREREALRWVSIGKSDWDISAILHVSERTARAHVLSAVHKLKAANRSAAVAEALSRGEIPLNY